MNDLKVGTKVKVVRSSLPTYWYASEIGKVFTVKKFNGNNVEVEEKPNHYLMFGDFEIVDSPKLGFVVNADGGMKGDGDKLRPTILLKDLQESVMSVIKVLEYGAKKYNRQNYAKVETERYEDAILRHTLAHLSGEKNDSETGESHLAHVVCCALFIMQKELKSE